jgi:predicted amidophosphoribosyltransferase
MFCTNCGGKVEDGVKFCPSCGKAASGTPVEPVAQITQQPVVSVAQIPMADEKYCSSCGSVIKKIAEICPKCGVKQNTVPFSQNVLTNKKNNIVFIILSIFLIVSGMTLYIFAYYFSEQSYNEYITLAKNIPWGTVENNQRRDNFFQTAYYERHKIYAPFSAIAPGLITIGLLFSIILLYRNQNKMNFWLCVSPCVLLVLWNGFVWFTRYF